MVFVLFAKVFCHFSIFVMILTFLILSGTKKTESTFCEVLHEQNLLHSHFMAELRTRDEPHDQVHIIKLVQIYVHILAPITYLNVFLSRLPGGCLMQTSRATSLPVFQYQYLMEAPPNWQLMTSLISMASCLPPIA